MDNVASCLLKKPTWSASHHRLFRWALPRQWKHWWVLAHWRHPRGRARNRSWDWKRGRGKNLWTRPGAAGS